MDALKGLDIDELRTYRCIFTPMVISTITVQAHFSNLHFKEADLIDFVTCPQIKKGPIMKIDCNYGHWKSNKYVSPKKERKSNRGRKPQPPKPTTRRRLGDGTNFDSQIQFCVLGTHDRPVPPGMSGRPERRTKNTIPLPDRDGVKWERITKLYLLKLFRNGKIVVPGVLCEDLSDIEAPLKYLARYISKIVDLEKPSVRLTSYYPIMRNYKLELIGCHDKEMPVCIDLRKLQAYGNKHFYTLLNTNINDITELILRPIFDSPVSPHRNGWKEFTRSWNAYNTPMVDTRLGLNWLQDKVNNKNLYVNAERLAAILQQDEFKQIYDFFMMYLRHTKVALPDFVLQRILYYMMHDRLEKLYKSLTNHPDNKLSYIRYDSERYNGFLIKIKTPTKAKPDKKTTVKIFASGKINIDGDNDRAEAELIYLWLNKLFVTNPDLLYRKGEHAHQGPDPEFPDEVPDDEDDDDDEDMDLEPMDDAY